MQNPVSACAKMCVCEHLLWFLSSFVTFWSQFVQILPRKETAVEEE